MKTRTRIIFRILSPLNRRRTLFMPSCGVMFSWYGLVLWSRDIISLKTKTPAAKGRLNGINKYPKMLTPDLINDTIWCHF